MEKVYAHREFGLEANIIGCATYELKATDFMPEYLSKLNYYISAIDDLIKTPEDNPTIGLLLCRSKNNTKVEYALRGMTQPLGVAEYQTNKIIEELKSELPSIDDLEKTMKDLTTSEGNHLITSDGQQLRISCDDDILNFVEP